MRRLMEKATVHNYVEAALQNTIETGAERELADALEVRRGPGYVDGVVLPWVLLLPEEKRAATTTTQNDGPVRQVPIIDRLFRQPDGIMDMLGVGLMSSGTGPDGVSPGVRRHHQRRPDRRGYRYRGPRQR